MKKILLSLKLLALAFCLSAQTNSDLLREDVNRAGGVMHSYEFHEILDTPAPEGYHPFYVSHFGRHGSRNLLSERDYSGPRDILMAADSAGLLTEKGKTLLNEVDILYKDSENLYGELTPRGGMEHYTIADRMYHRFPDVFNSTSRHRVNCFSSTTQRCIISMAYFTNSLKGNAPMLDFNFNTGLRYMRYISNDRLYNRDQWELSRKVSDELRAKGPKDDRFLKQIVKNTGKFRKLKNSERLMGQIFSLAGVCQDVDYLGINLYKYLTQEEIEHFWSLSDIGMYAGHGNTAEYGYDRICLSGRLLKDIVDRADAAVEGSDVAADLRFGHDTGIMPMLGLMGLETGKACKTSEIPQGFADFKEVPTAANIQLIFFRNNDGDVLVKFLHNEKEEMVPALNAVSGPYYKWTDVKEYLGAIADKAIARTEELEAQNRPRERR